MAECFASNKSEVEKDCFPLSYSLLDEHQKQDDALLRRLRTGHYSTSTFRCGGDSDRVQSIDLITYNGKIVVPQLLQKRMLQWYHSYLLHPGQERTQATIQQHFYWPNMRVDIQSHVKSCDICQKYKRQKKKYGHLPPKKAEAEPWEILCVDLIGPYKIHQGPNRIVNGKRVYKLPPLELKAVTMIDPATGWFEIKQYDDKRAITVAECIEQEWLNRYPWPRKIQMDRGKEFVGHEFKNMCKDDYNIKCKFITTRNPQANAIIERVHQVLGNLIRSYELEDNYMDEKDPWAGILTAAAFALRSTVHTTLKATPGQLVFGRDMMLNVKHEANWQAIKERKQRLIHKNNKRENSRRIDHTYHPGDKVLLEKDANKLERDNEGPYEVVNVFDNGTVTLRMGAILERINIRRMYPYQE